MSVVYFVCRNLSDLPEDDTWLAAGERARIAGMRFPKRRDDWLVGRWTAKCALRAFLSRIDRGPAPQFSEIEIRNAPDGAPEAYVRNKTAPVSLALSHSAGRGFCAIGPENLALGCDLETIQSHDSGFAEDYFCADEVRLVAHASAEEQPLLITAIWSAKESALKCLRAGLRRDTRSVQVSIVDERSPGWSRLAVRCMESELLFPGWWRTAEGFVQTITAGSSFPEPVELT